MADLTTKQLSVRFDVHITTVRLWIKNGLFPGAREEQTPRGPIWLVPEEDLAKFTPPPMGRPRQVETPEPVEQFITKAVKKDPRKKK